MWEWHHGGAAWGWGWVWMIVVMAIVWVPLVFAFVWFLRSAAGRGRAAPGAGDGGEAPRSAVDVDAREIARRAYARGELDRERFLQIMEDLGGGPHAGPGGGGPPA